MHIHLFSSMIIFILTSLPTSLTTSRINRVSAGAPLSLQCRLKSETTVSMAPFPSHCRTLASRIRTKPDSTRAMIFDPRSDWPTQPHIPAPYQASWQTCNVLFTPYVLDPSTRPGSNFATYASFANAIEKMVDQCFTVGPGQESKDFLVAFAKYDQEVVPLGTEKWIGAMTGPSAPAQVGSANVTAEGGGLNATEIMELWASMNGSTNGLVDGASGTAEQPRVDVT